MELKANLTLTQKGVEEVTTRVHKLGIRLRSVIILLGKPTTLENLLQRQQLFNQKELLEIIDDLVNDGFVAVNGVAKGGAAVHATGGKNQLVDGIIISEAKFLLVDFCVDSFGTQSQKFIDELGECKNEKGLELCLKNIYETTEKLSPDSLRALVKIINEINETAG